MDLRVDAMVPLPRAGRVTSSPGTTKTKQALDLGSLGVELAGGKAIATAAACSRPNPDEVGQGAPQPRRMSTE